MTAHIQTINQKSSDCFPVTGTSLEDDLEIDPADNSSIKFKVECHLLNTFTIDKLSKMIAN